MGTQIRMVFYTENPRIADSVSKVVFDRIDALNTIFSDYLPTSELNRLCATSGRDIRVSSELYDILSKAKDISEHTRGAFDVTAGPVTHIWRQAIKESRLPSKTALAKARKRVGIHLLKLNADGTVKLKRSGMQLDLGGIGKGYAADMALKTMAGAGIPCALVDMGGDIRVGEAPPGKDFWTVAFSYRDTSGVEVVSHLNLVRAAIATSGDLYRSMTIGGNTYSHIVDPISGQALVSGIQATVIADDATQADAYASAYSVLGIERAIMPGPDLPIHVFVVRQGGAGFKVWESPGFHNYRH